MSNAFESGNQKLVPAVLIYAFQGKRVLMLHRNANPKDFHLNKWNGLGGKLDKAEGFRAAAAREFLEESGLALSLERFTWTGVLYFPNFKAALSQDWLVQVFTVELRPDEKPLHEASNEGSLEFVAIEKILDLPLWEGDRHFLPKVFNREKFSGTFWYSDKRLERFELS